MRAAAGGLLFCAELLAVPASAADGANTGSAAVTNLPAGMILRDRAGQYVKLNEVCYPGEEKARQPRRILILDFMNCDCQPCRRELPELLAFLRAARTNAVEGYLVSLDPLSKGEQLEKFLAEMKVDCGVLLDPYRVTAAKLGVVGIPRTFVFAPDGRIVGDIAGKTDNLTEQLKAAVEKARW
jgi:thiol-disulfide isomerase/thioredoxin